ncbi:MAG: hypothetical protein M0P61_15225 [Ignavibacteriaceae bacterium]|jgi:hypothetical protein|nr:hypothetical protein [Ignavibacteriaceae bacterium]
MANEKSNLLTAGKIAVQLGVSGGAVSKAIKTVNVTIPNDAAEKVTAILKK